MPRKVKTEWKSTEKNPDEAHLKAKHKAETASQQNAFVEEAKNPKRRKDSVGALLDANGVSERDLDRKSK